MSRRMAPNRQNLLRLRRETRRTGEGLSLLRSKRQALTHAFLASVRERVRFHDLLGELGTEAGVSLARTYAVEGLAGVASHGWAGRREFPLEVERETVWGIPVTSFRSQTLVRDFRHRGYDPAASSAAVAEAGDRFEELLAAILDAAAVDVRLKRLGREIQKTSRRINALEERRLPELRHAAKQIRERLDEMERDEGQRLRRLQRRRQQRQGLRRSH